MGPLDIAIGASYRVFAPDWPGYGESDRPQILHTVPFYISVLSGFLEGLALPKPNLAGISMGGAVAFGFALEYPQSARRLVLVDSYGIQDRVPGHRLSYVFLRTPLVNKLFWAAAARSRWLVRAALQRIIHDRSRITEDLVESVCVELGRPGSTAAFQSFQLSELRWRGVKTVYMNRLHEIRIPTLLVHGTKDSLVPLRYAEEAHARISGSRLTVIPGAGHWAQRERPEVFLEAVSSFVRG
ncbi:MAG: alpha/beta fold hydrolase [Anaerolineales bacterium]